MTQYFNEVEYVTADGKHYYTADYIKDDGRRGHYNSPIPPEKASVKPNRRSPPGPTANACGIICPKTQSAPAGAAKDPKDSAQTQEESAWDQFKQKAKDGAEYYKDNVSEDLHKFAGSAMETGGTVAVAGEGTMLAGAGLAATGVGAPVAAALEVVGGATTAVGGGVAAVGGLSEGAATFFDSAAEMIITGETPDLIGPLIQMGETLLTRLITSRVPGANLGKKQQPNKPNKGKGKEEGNKKDKSDKGDAADGSGGGYVLGVGGPCIVGKYSEIKDKCGEGQQAHHIVADRWNRTSNRAQGAKGIGRIPGMPSLADGPAICLQGHAKTDGSEHNTAHQTDSEIHEAAQRTDNGIVGTLPVKEAVPKSIRGAIAARPDCAAQIEAAVRQAYPNYENDNRSLNGEKRPPTGEVKDHLDSGGKSTDSKQVGGRKGKFK